jgi:hypothetical protein
MLVDLVSLKICEHDIREKYLDYILEKIIKIDIQNKQSDSGNYIGLTWIKNQLQSKNFIQIDGEGVSFSGSNASIILEFLTENGYIINLVEDKISKIIPNYGNEYVKEILNKTTSHD